MQKYKYVDGYEGGWMEPAAHDSQEFYVASEVDALMREVVECMNGGAYGIAALKLIAVFDPPTTEL